MKHCAVAPAIEEPAPDPGAPACRVCHVSLREFVAPQSYSTTRSGDAQLLRNLCYFRGSEGPSIDPEKEEERLQASKSKPLRFSQQ